MSALRLAKPDDLARILPMVEAFHQHMGIKSDDAHRQAAIAPLLDGLPHGAVYLIGPNSAPVGYIVISFGWSVEFGGLDVVLDEFYVRERVRGRGMGGEALRALMKTLSTYGVKAMSLEVDTTDAKTHALYKRLGFRLRDSYGYMSAELS